MQRVERDLLVRKAVSLMEFGVCDRVLAWKEGEFSYDVEPHVFTDTEKIKNELVWNDFCGANFSKYLISETQKTDKKVLVFLKPCDSYSFNELLTEHRFDREKVYAVAIPCEGMVDIKKIKEKVGGISSVRSSGEKVIVSTLFDGDVTFDKKQVLAERCLVCKSKKHVAYDEVVSTGGEGPVFDRFGGVDMLEGMTPDERYEFWQGELSRCIRCNACRDVCPACTCEKCVFTNPASGVENKAAENSFEEKMFHIIRAFHVAGRCTDCGECSRVCPQSIPLHLLNRKFIKDINTLYGDYQAGETVGQRSPLVDFAEGDVELGEVFERRGDNA